MRCTLTFLALGLAALLPSCVVVADESDPAPPARSDYTGALVVDWTVDGAASPDECDQGDASWLHLRLYDSSGHVVGDFSDDCAAFSTSVELDPGTYYGDAVLEDADGRECTTAVAIDDFTILGRDTLSVPIDFPARSFY